MLARARVGALGCLMLVLALASQPRAAVAASGVLDPDFAAAGTLSLSVAPGNNVDEALAVAVDDEQRIVAAGYAADPAEKIAVVRLAADGSLDSTFASSGVAKVTVGSRGRAQAMVLQADRKIVVVGYAVVNGTEQFAVVRLLANGSPDPGFGAAGIVVTPFGTRDARAQAVALQSDDKIVVGGWARNSSNRDLALARYTTSGTLDPDFGLGGKLTLGVGAGNDEIDAIAVQPADGRIVVGGYAADGSEYDLLVARFTDHGQPDASFNTTGQNRISLGDGVEIGRALLLEPGGGILLAGETRVGGTAQFAVARVDGDGILDATFHGGGTVSTPIGDLAEGRAIAPASHGRFVVVGTARTSGMFTGFAAARYLSDGSIDPTFGTAGIATFPIGNKSDEVYGVALQADGGIVLAGSARTGTNLNFAFARLVVDACGDGFRDPGEECDEDAGAIGSCCSAQCTIRASGSVCREAAGTCDVAEVCDGASSACPDDVVVPSGVGCRAAAGVCDVAEQCNGSDPRCPVDLHVASGTVCRPGTDLCDPAESCDGTSNACPDDKLAASGAICRASTGGCDPAEVCDGATASCPSDALLPAGAVCRAATDACDVAESCDGVVAACPSDAHLPDGDGDGVCDAHDDCPFLANPTQSDADGDGIGDACDPCSSGIELAKPVVKFGGLLTPPGDDTFKLLADITFASPPTLAPASVGAHLVLQTAAGSTLFDVQVPPGAYSDDTRTGWKSSGAGKLYLFKSPNLLGGLVRKVQLKRALFPGRYHVKITGQLADFASQATLDAIKVLLVIDPTPPVVTLCGEASLASPRCALNPDTGVLACK